MTGGGCSGFQYGFTFDEDVNAIPIIAGHGSLTHAVRAADYINPLPHVLMLTAIVVGVATTGIALALLVILYRKYGTLEEDEIIKAIKQ